MRSKEIRLQNFFLEKSDPREPENLPKGSETKKSGFIEDFLQNKQIENRYSPNENELNVFIDFGICQYSDSI